jgi:hypothetical protein
MSEVENATTSLAASNRPTVAEGVMFPTAIEVVTFIFEVSIWNVDPSSEALEFPTVVAEVNLTTLLLVPETETELPDDPDDPDDPLIPEDPEDPEDPAAPLTPDDPDDPEDPAEPAVPLAPDPASAISSIN